MMDKSLLSRFLGLPWKAIISETSDKSLLAVAGYVQGICNFIQLFAIATITLLEVVDGPLDYLTSKGHWGGRQSWECKGLNIRLRRVGKLTKAYE
jgi:hypothetical protein